MDEQDDLRQSLQLWRDTGAPQALAKALGLLLAWLSVPPQLARALGDARSGDVQMQVIEKLLSDKGAVLLQARNPRAFARKALTHGFLDALRQQARARFLDHIPPGEFLGRVHAQSGPDVETRYAHEERASAVVQALKRLSWEERMSLLLLYMPRHITESEWEEVERRHASPRLRPDTPLEREEIASLLFPDEDPKKTYERVTKLIQRTQKKLRVALAEAERLPGEEVP